MTIEILEERIAATLDANETPTRTVRLLIDDTYEWWVGGLPLTGDLMPLLLEKEAIYLAEAISRNKLLNVYNIEQRKITKAVALVILDELNNHAVKINAILDAIDAATSLAEIKASISAIDNYPQRDESQIRRAIITKLKNIT